MTNRRKIGFSLAAVFLFFLGCGSESSSKEGYHGTLEGTTGEDSGTSTETQPFDDSASTTSDDASDGDSETHSDPEPLLADCGSCPAVGSSLENMRCAVDLCDDAVFLGQQYASPTVEGDLGSTYAAVERFGDAGNDLAPRRGASYALMATGPACGTDHDVELDASFEAQGFVDAFSSDKQEIHDVMEWRVRLRVPKGAQGFRVDYVFFSQEFDEYVDSPYNDKFYIIIEAPSTSGGAPTVINFTDCRKPDAYADFVCDGAADFCEEGQRYCYIAINTALSECCWYRGCPSGTATTDISGTGFSCGTEATDGKLTQGNLHGSSTGWLRTEWPVTAGEEITVTFHIHDTQDGKLDSEVIIDNFVFVGNPNPGTVPI